MSRTIALHSAQQSSPYPAELMEILSRLETLEAEMRADGLVVEAGGLRTVIDDLQWQHEELLLRGDHDVGH